MSRLLFILFTLAIVCPRVATAQSCPGPTSIHIPRGTCNAFYWPIVTVEQDGVTFPVLESTRSANDYGSVQLRAPNVVHLAGDHIKAYVSDWGGFQWTNHSGTPFLKALINSGYSRLQFDQLATGIGLITMYDSSREDLRVPLFIRGQSPNGGDVYIAAGEPGPTKKGTLRLAVNSDGYDPPEGMVEMTDLASGTSRTRVVGVAWAKRYTGSGATGIGSGAGDGVVHLGPAHRAQTSAPDHGCVQWVEEATPGSASFWVWCAGGTKTRLDQPPSCVGGGGGGSFRARMFELVGVRGEAHVY